MGGGEDPAPWCRKKLSVTVFKEEIRVLQLSFSKRRDEICFKCISLGGDEVCTVMLHEYDLIALLPARIAAEISVPRHLLRLVLPDGSLLTSKPPSTRMSELLNISS